MLALGAMLVLSPAPAFATPPDVIEVHDEPFGLSKQHLYVLRTTTDNLGLYESTRIETFLVAINLVTSAEEYWPVYRALKTTDYDETGKDLGVVIRPDETTDLADPIAILAANGGIPWGALYFPKHLNADFQVSETSSAFVLDRKMPPPLSLKKSDVAERLAAMSGALAKQISNYPRMSAMQTTDFFADRLIDPKSCKPGQVFRPYPPFRSVETIAIRLDCTADEDIGSTSVIQLFAVDLLVGGA